MNSFTRKLGGELYVALSLVRIAYGFVSKPDTGWASLWLLKADPRSMKLGDSSSLSLLEPVEFPIPFLGVILIGLRFGLVLVGLYSERYTVEGTGLDLLVLCCSGIWSCSQEI